MKQMFYISGYKALYNEKSRDGTIPPRRITGASDRGRTGTVSLPQEFEDKVFLGKIMKKSI